MTYPPIRVIAGPSHAIRWQAQVRDGVVRSPVDWERIIGVAGAPTWHASLLRRAARAAGEHHGVAVLVGDFRFGNAVLLVEPEPPVALLDDFAGIDAGAMSAAHDRRMLDRGLAGVRAWSAEFGDRAIFVLWDAFGRQVHDRLAGRHIGDGPYRHPVFNYDEIAASLPEVRIADLAPLLRLPMHEVRRLFVDSSNHPSQVGYRTLTRMLMDGEDALTAYSNAIGEVEAELMDVARGLVQAARRTVLVTGRSVWLEALSMHLGPSGIQRLAEVGLVLAPLDRIPGQAAPSQMMEPDAVEKASIVVVSAGGVDLTGELTASFGSRADVWRRALTVDWELATESVILGRRETPSFTRIAGPRVDSVVQVAQVESADVEHGKFGMPTWRGITTLLAQVRALLSGIRPGRSLEAYEAAPFLSLKHSTYFAVYDQLLACYAGRAPVMVEVGVLNGGSLFMWRELLGPDARIVGVDLNPEAVWLREEGFEIHIGDQSDPAFWDAFFQEVGSVDILLDDGGHTYAQQIVTAEAALDRIKDGGVLIVEDTHTSYMESFGGPSDRSFVSWAMDVVHGVNRRFSAFAAEHPTERRAWSVAFYESIVAFHVDRGLAEVESRQTTNGGVSRDAKDFRYHRAAAVRDDELAAYFRHRGD